MSRARPVRAVVLRTAGTNCDEETAYGFEKVGAEAERVHVNRLADSRRALDRFHILAIPGGFSYGDDIASGKVLANEIRYRMEEEVRRFVAAGKLIIGICNGFQVLVKAGLLPRLHGEQVVATLTVNDRALFEDRWVYLRIEESPCVFARPGDSLYLPVAHGEGKFIAGRAALGEIERRKLVVARYAGPEGGLNPGYPWNPNGSAADIAGICDPTGRIFGLMPHPERHVEPTQHPRWTREGAKPEGDGVRVFRNAVEFARRNLV